jgi:uncharacterized membrane protein
VLISATKPVAQGGRAFGIVIALAVLAGILLRFYNLDHKVFWDDEVYSALRVNGYTERDLVRRADQFQTAGELRALLHSRADGLPATVTAIAHEEPQHTPLFYLLANIWSHAFGSSLFSMRFLAALFGVLALPAMYWLGFELFGSRRAAGIAAALLAISPVAVLYSQEFREYSMWTVAILVMSALFLRAVRLMTLWTWAWFAVALTISLYVDPLTLFIAGGYGIFYVTSKRPRAKDALAPALAYAMGFVLFVPWLMLIVRGARQIDKATELGVGTSILVFQTARTFLAMFKADFLDLNIVDSALVNAVLAIPAATVVVYAMYVTCKRTKYAIWGFILTLMLANLFPVIGLYLLSAGVRLAPIRLLIPFFLAADLALVVLFETTVASPQVPLTRRRIWAAAFVLIAGAKLSQCVLSSRAETWWNTLEQQSISVAQIVNRSQHPVLVDDNYLVYALALSEYLKPDVRVVLSPRCYLCADAPDRKVTLAIGRQQRFGDVFLLGPSLELQAQARQVQSTAADRAHYYCINVFQNCASSLQLFQWSARSRL